MKTLRILFVALLPVLGFVGCQKSDIRPSHCGSESATTQKEQTNEAPINGRVSSPSTENTVTNPPTTSQDIVGSGDDDREGGDKKSKGAGR